MSFRENVIASQAGFITGVCMLDVHVVIRLCRWVSLGFTGITGFLLLTDHSKAIHVSN